MSKKRRLIQPINNFTCCEKTMSHKEFMDHLKSAHGLDPKGMKGKKSLLMHIDYADSYDYNWQWELENGLKFTQYTRQARSKDSMMY